MQHLQRTLNDEQMAKTKVQLDQRIKEQKVLENELNSLKKDAKVYRQQQNSNILFVSGVEQEMSRAKKTMDSLVQEYQQLELAPTQHYSEEMGKEEGDGGTDTPLETKSPG